MTDEKNQHQRHLAKMLLAQCDKKILQYETGGVWVTMPGPLFEYPHLSRMRVRIKPEPREWFLCLACNGRYCNGFPVHDFPGTGRHCHGEKVRVREVLND